MDLNVLRNINYGMYIVSSNKGDLLNGQIANTVFQITTEPVTIAVSINKKNLTHEFIENSKHFSVSILSEDTALSFIGKFGFKSGRDGDKFKDVNFKKLSSWCPVVLDNAISYLELRVINKFDCITHTVFLSEMVGGEVLTLDKAMTYKYYQEVKRGVTPQTAPTFIKGGAVENGVGKMQKYQCTICGYIYDPALGDSDGGIKPGTRFEDIPDTWVCPVCGAAKDKFVKIG